MGKVLGSEQEQNEKKGSVLLQQDDKAERQTDVVIMWLGREYRYPSLALARTDGFVV